MSPDPSPFDLNRPKFRLRVITSLVAIVLAVALIWFAEWPMAVFVFVLSVFASRELYWLFEEKGYRPARYLGTAASLSIIVLTALTGTKYHAPFMVASFVLACLFLIIRSAPWFPYQSLLGKASDQKPNQIGTISDVATTFLGIVLTGWLPSYIPLLRQLQYPDLVHREAMPHLGMGITFLYFGAIIATDVGAYLIGKSIGRRPLIGPLSPKKTVEGSLGGILLAVLAAALIGWGFHLDILHCMALGAVISVVAQISDLTESMIKRDAGKKDSGDIIPGHGGVLDRVDSYLLSGAVAYYYLFYIWHVVY
ncbi:phosphatidate cytidylyltransferase [bacterium]|nr:phosphatidate cytidylyltransferase [bacterium]